MSIHRLSPITLLVGLVVTAVASHPAQAETLLRWKFEQGQKTRMVITQEMQMKMVMQEKPIQTTNTSTMEFDMEVTALDEQGVASMSMTADRIRMKMKGPQGVMMEYDSQSDKKPEGMAAMMATVFEGMLDNKPYTTKMDPRGKILEMKLPQGFAESMNKLPGGAQLGSMFTEESMKGMAETATFPEKPLKPGDTWTHTTKMKNPVIGDLIEDTTSRYVGSEVRDGRELEKITLDVKMRVGEGGNVKMKIADQSNTGTLYFDNAAGQFVSSDSKTKMKMKISVLGQEMEQEMEIRSKVETRPKESAEKNAE
jgi:hypothetical protein